MAPWVRSCLIADASALRSLRDQGPERPARHDKADTGEMAVQDDMLKMLNSTKGQQALQQAMIAALNSPKGQLALEQAARDVLREGFGNLDPLGRSLFTLASSGSSAGSRRSTTPSLLPGRKGSRLSLAASGLTATRPFTRLRGVRPDPWASGRRAAGRGRPP